MADVFRQAPLGSLLGMRVLANVSVIFSHVPLFLAYATGATAW